MSFSHPLLSLLRPELSSLAAYPPAAHAMPAKLDANECPWSFDEAETALLATRLAALPLHRYPDPGAAALKAAICQRFGGDPQGLVVGNGLDEVIQLLLTACSRPRSGCTRATVLFPSPTFVMYGIDAVVAGMTSIAVPLGTDWQLDRDAILEAIALHRPNLIFLASPNNPTGNLFAEADVRAVIEAAPDALVAIDEAYAPFADRRYDTFLAEYPNVALLRTLSKVGLAGLRIGWAHLPTPLAAAVDKIRQPYNLNALSQCAAELALGELYDTFEQHVKAVVRERGRLRGMLCAFESLHAYPSDANFMLVRVDGDVDALCESLRAAGISVRNFHGRSGRLAQHIRITVGAPHENLRLFHALTDYYWVQRPQGLGPALRAAS